MRRGRGRGRFGHPRVPCGPWHWRRSREDRIAGGVAGGLAAQFRIDVTLVRIGFVIASLAGGCGVAAYLAGWLLMPLEGRDESIAARVARDRQGILLALAFVPALVVTLVVGAVLHAGAVTSIAWPLFACAAGAVLLWRNVDPEEREWLHAAGAPIVHLGSGRRSTRAFLARIALGVAVFVIGLALLVVRHDRPVSVLRPIGGVVLVVAAIIIVFGPWWLRLIRDLVAERQARTRAEERADVAARVHDSVLQTLALIQRAADEPQRVVQLARAQERELRAWLFDGDIPGAVGDDVATLAAGAHAVAREVEGAHGVPVEVVTVGDCPLDDALRALLAAAREATVNAAKWSGAPMISLFAEVEPEKASVFVRDRGRGFDPDGVAADRRGIAESIQARMLRNGGRAVVRTSGGEGTEVELTVPRRPRR